MSKSAHDTTTTASFSEQVTLYQQRVDKALLHWLPAKTLEPTQLHQAMQYAVVGGGGKRIRPFLVYATGLAVGLPLSQLDAAACAVELIHAYSLVHDDLPAMDDDDLRRGRPTCHKAFDEATAILAGDALQCLAFEILAEDPNLTDNPAIRLQMMQTLAHASGSRGMAGGQAIDLAAVNQQISLPELENMHKHKTGALIEASVQLGYMGTNLLSAKQQQQLQHYAQSIGLAFQVQDDILDIISDTETLGKTQGADIALNKPTFPSLLGLDGAQEKARELHTLAINSLVDFDENANLLRQIADYIVQRTH